MARIAGVNLPPKKRIIIALTYIYGIGRSKAAQILKEAGVNFDKKVQDLTQAEENALRQIIETKHKVEGELRLEVKQNIKVLQDIGTYRGTRHRKNLPARGQGTRTNSRTVRGNVRKTMGSGRAKAAQKT